MEMLVEMGYKVVLLTTCEEGLLHSLAREIGVVTESSEVNSNNKLHYYFSQLMKLNAIIKKYRIDIIIAHQQKPALIAGLLKKFVPFKLIYVRHNSDEDYVAFPLKAKWLNSIVNSLTPIKIAPSDIVQRFWIDKEKVNSNQIHRINYGYNFQQYEDVNYKAVELIKKEYNAQLLLISIARLVPVKRHREMFTVIQKMRSKGIDCKLICLGDGPMMAELGHLIQTMNLKGHVILLGRKENIFDYIEAADLFIHLSTTEASNSAVKEVGLCKKPVIVCNDVGDFGEYVNKNVNGFLVNKENPIDETCSILEKVNNHSINLNEIGNRFNKTVIEMFHINNVITKYKQVLNFDKPE
jgi:glycosyltransferase involved in cell wall biosynthesis